MKNLNKTHLSLLNSKYTRHLTNPTSAVNDPDCCILTSTPLPSTNLTQFISISGNLRQRLSAISPQVLGILLHTHNTQRMIHLTTRFV